MRQSLARVHIWLGWIVGIPLLLWTGTGLFMVAQPIDTVRGEHLKHSPGALVLPDVVALPDRGARPIKEIALASRPDGPKWVITYLDGGGRLADPATGALLPFVDAANAVRNARAAFAGKAPPQSVTRTSADSPPLDLRRARPAWRVTFTDETRIYIDAETGAVLATRTKLWRVFDFMWGLHIMDLQTREDTSHPVLIGFAALALVSLIVGLILLPFRRRQKR